MAAVSAHGPSREADARLLVTALALIVALMAGEVVAGVLAGSLALLSDAGHLLTDAAALALALVASRLAARPAGGPYTYGLRRAEILAAQVNGLTLALLAVLFTVEGVRRLLDPPDVTGWVVTVTALVGVVVNLVATWLVGRADRRSLNVEGAYLHLLTDLLGFIATAVSGVVVMTTGFARADALAALVVAALMLRASWTLLRDSGRIFLEAAPRGIVPAEVEAGLQEVRGVTGVHDLHVWEVTSGFPALSAHVLVDQREDCHERREALESLLGERFGLTHTTLQVDHAAGVIAPEDLRSRVQHLPDVPY